MMLKREIALRYKVVAIYLLIIFGFSDTLYAQLSGTNRNDLPDNINPAKWADISIKKISIATKELQKISDTSIVEKDINGLRDNLNKLKLNHNAIESQSNLRNFYNLRNQFGLLIEDANRFKKKMKKEDAVLALQLELINQSANHSLVNNVFKDSALNIKYAAQFKSILSSLDSLNNQIKTLQKTYALDMSLCSYIILTATEEYNIINKEMDEITKNLLHPEEPSFIHLSKNNYPSFGPTFKATCQQKADLLLSYSKASLWDLILLRVVVLIFAFVPLWYVKKIYRKNEGTVYTRHFRYVHNHAALMAPTIILILAPILFHYPPMLLLDLLFITVAFSILTILLKENKTLNKKHILPLLFFYIILKIDNLLVSVTLVDRIVFALSVFTLPIFFQILKWVKLHVREFGGYLSAILYIVMFAILMGFIFNMNGNFILSKNIILTSFEGLIFIFMLYFTINGIGDYILITGDLFHRKKRAAKTHLLHLHFNIRPVLIVLAVLYWIVAFLVDLNLFHFVAYPLIEYMQTPVSFAGIHFTMGHLYFILIFATILFFSFSGIKKNTHKSVSDF